MKKYLILFILGSIAYSNSFNFQEHYGENKLLSYESYDNIYAFDITINFCPEDNINGSGDYICPPGFYSPNSGLNSIELNTSLLEINEWSIVFSNYFNGQTQITQIVGINTTMQNPISAGCGIIAEFDLSGNIHTVEGQFAGQNGVDLSFYFNNFLEIDYNSQCSLILGDTNGDGVLNVVDIVSMVSIILDGSYNSQADLNDDEIVNVVDIVSMVDWILNGVPVDACGEVGGDDLNDDGYHCGDIQVLQDIIDANPSLEGQNPLDIGWNQELQWNNGRLIYLNLLDNQLTSLPESIGELSSLKTLYLTHNQLTSLPESIGELSSLETFAVVDNQLTSLPESISELSSLETLFLSFNQLTSLPASICNLQSNYVIDVNYNNLCEEYHYDCIDDWGTQDQSNCCEGPEGQPNWTTCP